MKNNFEINIFVENTYEEKNFDDVQYHQNIVKIAKYFLSNQEIYSPSCLNKYDFKILSFDVVLCNDEKIHAINREYRKIDKPTDVITFALFADSSEEERFIFDDEINLGEILISLDTIEKQAKENNSTFDEELLLITSHGILHLLGFDHLTDDDYKFMVEKQSLYKNAINSIK